MIPYIDLLLSTSTDDIGDFMSTDLAPTLDIMLNDTMLMNAGIAVNLYDDIDRNEDIAINLAVVAGL